MKVMACALRVMAAAIGVGLVLSTGACGGGSAGSGEADGAGTVTTSPGAWATDIPVELAGGASSPSAAAAADPVAAPGAGGGAATQSAGAEGTGPLAGTIVPADFPIPPGATVTVSEAKATDATIRLEGIAPAAAVAYYRAALPGAGYKFFQEAGSEGRTKVTFTGRSQSVQVLAGGTRTPDLVLVIFTQCTSAVSGGDIEGRRSDRVACV
ncbi:hypothetical protein CcI49_12400 [Frankia sp. CcI49]|uniref:hypothetical protein n=1 Tax=Frankia sp. CcI49 TaxID=1745382 RepID=UPI00097698F9|nr:hypothetical protein [Frankia sp. CcI49]ONH60188.1 hypothetical protein CcI49_12400 [Frankia sp. CcI49]